MIEQNTIPTTLDRPIELACTSREDWVLRSEEEVADIANRVFDYYMAKANAKWGHLLGNESFQCRLTIRRIKGSIVGYAKGLDTVEINSRFLNIEADQWDVITETIPHEIAHIIFFNLLRSPFFLSTISSKTRVELFGRKRIPWHGKFWKHLFCQLTGLKKVRNRFFRQVER